MGRSATGRKRKKEKRKKEKTKTKRKKNQKQKQTNIHLIIISNLNINTVLSFSLYVTNCFSLYPQTTYTTSFVLYHLAVNPEVQNKLYEESCQLLAKPNCAVTTSVLAKAQYTKAVLKETFRMNPVSVGVGRILAQDTILSGYHVPKGVSVHVFTVPIFTHLTPAQQLFIENFLKTCTVFQENLTV